MWHLPPSWHAGGLKMWVALTSLLWRQAAPCGKGGRGEDSWEAAPQWHLMTGGGKNKLISEGGTVNLFRVVCCLHLARCRSCGSPSPGLFGPAPAVGWLAARRWYPSSGLLNYSQKGLGLASKPCNLVAVGSFPPWPPYQYCSGPRPYFKGDCKFWGAWGQEKKRRISTYFELWCPH